MDKETIGMSILFVGIIITIIGLVIIPTIEGSTSISMVDNIEVTHSITSSNILLNSNTIALFGTLIGVFGITFYLLQ